MLKQGRGSSAVFDDRTIGCEIAAQNGKPAFGLQWIIERADDIAVLNFALTDIFSQGFPARTVGVMRELLDVTV